MTGIWTFLIALVAFAIFGALIGGLLSGIDRKITARMQHRVGPPILQPFYDVAKLLSKERVALNGAQDFYTLLSLMLCILAGGLFFSGNNLLIVIFVITLASLFFVIAGYSTRSPYAEVGAEREILQITAYEPMVLLMSVGYYLALKHLFGFGSFDTFMVSYIPAPLIIYMPLVFIGFAFVLTIKLRKSPFDLSMSHHAHQELVKGITTEMSGSTLAKVEVMHWYENVLFLGWIGLFLVWGGSGFLGWIVGVLAVLLIYFIEILIDNNFARVKWQATLKWSWLVTLVLAAINIAVIMFVF